MNLQELIREGLLKEIDDMSISQIIKKFERGISYLNFAKKNLIDSNENYNLNIYTNIYNATRIIGEAFLLLNGYKATIKDHHKTVIQASELIMNDETMNNVFRSLDRMRKNRNKIDYETEVLDISEQALQESIENVQKLADKIKNFIDAKNEQLKCI